jgi:DNA-binding NtrC family response regulator
MPVGASRTGVLSDTASVVLVEDDSHLRELVVEWLTEAPFPCAVTAVGTVAEAEEAVSASTDLLVVNRAVETFSGDVLVSALDHRGFDGAVVVVSGYERDEAPFGRDDGVRITDDDFDEYLRKPFARDDLLDAVRRALGGE